MTFPIQSFRTVVVACAIVMAAGAARATQTVVVDLDNVGVWDAYDLSTGGDDISALTASASLTGQNWVESNTYWWNGPAPFFNTVQTATWTVSGYDPGISVKVYVHWRDEGTQGNGDSAASYVVNGGTAVIKNQTVLPAADVALNDGVNDHSFEFIGTYAANGSGQVQVVLSRGNNWTVADSVAFETVPSIYTLIEDFESHGLASDIDSANGWVVFGDALPAGGSVVLNPAGTSGKVAQLTGTANNDGYILSLDGNSVTDGASATLFLRYRSTGAMSVYLTDADALHPPNWWREDEACIYNNDTSAPIDVLPRFDAGSASSISLDTWYNVWVMADHAADTASLYMSQGYDPAVGGATSVTVDTGVSLRGGAGAGTLDHVFMVSNNGAAGGMIDDIYIAPGVTTLLPPDLLPARGAMFTFK